MPSTTRLALPAPANTDAVAVPADILALAEALDDLAVVFDSGTFASRPAAGLIGRLWYSTNTGVLSWDTGAAWVDVNPSGVVDGAAGVGTLRTLGTGALQAVAGNDARLSNQRVPTDGSVSAAKVDATLKPSSGAGGSTEALRALGTAAGTAAAGSHASQHGPSGADPLPAPSWANVTFVNGWANLGGGLQAVQYARDAAGLVRLRGIANVGTGALAFTLPAGFRPPAQESFPVGPAADGSVKSLTIAPAGLVSADNTSLITVSFSGISFAP